MTVRVIPSLVLLAEDDYDLAERYERELHAADFNVCTVDNGEELYFSARVFLDLTSHLRGLKMIVSDTKLPRIDGDMACEEIIKLNGEERFGDEPNKVLIVGMSTIKDNDKKWIGLAHDFFWKGSIDDLGTKVKLLYEQFQRNPDMLRYKVFPKH